MADQGRVHVHSWLGKRVQLIHGGRYWTWRLTFGRLSVALLRKPEEEA